MTTTFPVMIIQARAMITRVRVMTMVELVTAVEEAAVVEVEAVAVEVVEEIDHVSIINKSFNNLSA